MARFILKARKKVGQAPGTVEFAGQKKMDKVRLRIMNFDPDRLEEQEPDSFRDLLPHRDGPGTSWINVDGLHETDSMAELSKHFGLHSLVMEDVVHTHQRPKIEDFPEHIFIVLQMLYIDVESSTVHSEQVSLIFGQNWVLTFQERVGDIFEGVRERLRKGRGRIRRAGADYLAYALVDALVDHYFKVLEHFGEEIEDLEERLLDDPTQELLERIHGIKRELVMVRRAVWPLREVIGAWMRSESPLVRDETQVFLRDIYDHTVQVADALESYRDILGGLQDLYLSSISNRMNEIMKVLTLIATIFIPLGFVAGIYGMNFEHMPELGWKYSYGGFWLLVLLAGGGMFAFFKRKRWL